MEQLHEATLNWAKDRGLLSNGKVTTQALKLGSEVGELSGNLADNKSIKDDIGDCMVVMTILADLQDNDLIDIINSIDPIYHKTPKLPTLYKYLGDLQDKVIKGEDFSIEIRNIVHQLHGICNDRHTSLEEGWAEAYEDIKDRQGFLNRQGAFIKSTDSNYDKLYLDFQIEELASLPIESIEYLIKGDDQIMATDSIDILSKLQEGYTAIPF